MKKKLLKGHVGLIGVPDFPVLESGFVGILVSDVAGDFLLAVGGVPEVQFVERRMEVVGILDGNALEPAVDELILAILHFGCLLRKCHLLVPLREDLHEKCKTLILHQLAVALQLL